MVHRDHHNKIGEINPTSHTITEFPIPTAGADALEITAGPDGNLWFSETGAAKVGSINPSTHAFVETSVLTASSEPTGITAGPDGNVWFAEQTGDRIGSINPITHGVTETAVPTAAALPVGITQGPDGNLWFTELTASKIGSLTPTLSLVATTEPPAFVTAAGPFGLTVTVYYQSGLLDSAFNGNVTVALATNPGGSTLGGTLTVAAKNGVATFTGLTLDKLGTGYRLMAFTDPLTSTLTTTVTVATPPTIVSETAVLAGKGRRSTSSPTSSSSARRWTPRGRRTRPSTP